MMSEDPIRLCIECKYCETEELPQPIIGEYGEVINYKYFCTNHRAVEVNLVHGSRPPHISCHDARHGVCDMKDYPLLKGLCGLTGTLWEPIEVKK